MKYIWLVYNVKPLAGDLDVQETIYATILEGGTTMSLIHNPTSVLYYHSGDAREQVPCLDRK